MANPCSPERTIVIKQKSLAYINIWEFNDAMTEFLNQGWRVVPGTVVIAISTDSTALQERYFAVVEK